MPTELPYAADAQMSLSYDELEVKGFPLRVLEFSFLTFLLLGTARTIPEGTCTGPCYHSDQVQLCLGPCEES